MKATPPALAGARFEPLGEAEQPALQRLLELCADFEILVTGAPATSEAAAELMTACPPGHPIEKKLVFGIARDGDLVGAVDLLRDFPEPDDWYLGLLLLAPQERGGGLGEAVVTALRTWIAAQGGRAIRLAVQQQNEAGERFWARMGFQRVGTAVQGLERRNNQVALMELDL
jgi:RimJ/RimL family protein N-acetyltransferase